MVRRPGRPSNTKSGAFRRRIVERAVDEFARAGFHGASIERIAKKARCNRALVYFYFKDKKTLFQAALDEGVRMRVESMTAQPASLKDALIFWFEGNRAEPRRLRLLMQEELSQLSLPNLGRAAYLNAQLNAVKAFQAAGLLRSDLDPRHLLTIILALTSFPAVFPRIAEVSLDAPDAAALAKEWAQALAMIAKLLAPPAS